MSPLGVGGTVPPNVDILCLLRARSNRRLNAYTVHVRVESRILYLVPRFSIQNREFGASKKQIKKPTYQAWSCLLRILNTGMCLNSYPISEPYGYSSGLQRGIFVHFRRWPCPKPLEDGHIQTDGSIHFFT